MNKLCIAVLLALPAGAALAADPHAASATAENTPTESITILRGQWTFLHASTAFCAERVPAMKNDLDDALERAEAAMAKAEAIILDETAQERARYKPYFDMYAGSWSKYAAELIEGLKRQDPRKACPDLLGNWQSADAELILEDWRGFVERNLQ